MAHPVGSNPASERWPRQAVLVAMIGGFVSVASSALVTWRERVEVREEFEAQAAVLLATANEEMSHASGAARAMQALGNSSQAVEANEFEDFARTLIAHTAHVEGLVWIERVPAHERDAWRRRVAARAGHGVEIVDARGAPVLAEHDSWPITLRHPPSSSRRPLGLDLHTLGLGPQLLQPTDPNRAQPLLIGFEEPDGGRRALLAFPVHGARAAPGALDLAPSAWVAAVVRVDELARSVARRAWAEGLLVTIATGQNDRPTSGLSAQGRLDPGPAGWRVVVNAAPGYAAQRTSSTAWIVLGLGLTLSAALTQRVRALELRTRALSHANAELYSEVAERHSAETKLRETQRALATLVANLPGVAYRCTNARDWPMEFISEGVAALTGYPARDFIDGVVRFGRDVIHPDDRDYVWNGVQQALERHKSYQLVYRIKTSTGQLKWVWEQGRGVFSRADELLALEGLINDITERKLAEEGFKREMRFVEAIIDSLPGNFYVFEESGRFLRWNANVERVTGYTPLELAAMSPMDFFEGADREKVERAVRQVFEEGRTLVDARLRSKSGESIPFHFTGVLFTQDGARYLVGVGIDVSERERALEEQARVHAQLLHTAKLESLGVMASSIAHDFNNILTLVLGSAELAQSSLDPGSEAHALLQRTLDASHNATEITRQLLSLARGEPSALDAVNLSELVRSLEKLLRSSTKKRIRIEYDLAVELPAIHADPVQLRQLVLNLVLNAGEACLRRGGVIRISTGAGDYGADELSTPAFRGEKRAGRHVFIEVRDDGDGMSPATLARLGEPFFTTRVAGRGLGLAAVLGILKGHDGWLEVESELDRGAKFRACFPAP